jgi:steroid 5-alpha reductase family enzyme
MGDGTSSAIGRTWVLCKGVILLTYVTSLLTGNYSQTDKLWSIVPWLHAWLLVAPEDPRTLLMAGLATLWGIRLTYNFNRRGGYHWPPWRGKEDYRWSYLQKGFNFPSLKNPVSWHVFNLLFISVYQNILLWLIVLPSMLVNVVATNKDGCFDNQKAGLNILDGIAAIGLLGFLLLETVADNQQFAFQTEKYKRKKEGRPLSDDRDFCQSGVYAWVRKPNYTGEQGIWVCFYLFSVACLSSLENTDFLERWFNCSILGCILLILLFQGSGLFTEEITISKYPDYRDYQARVPLYIPNLFSSSTQQSKSKAS